MASSYFTFTKQAGTGVQTVPGVAGVAGLALLIWTARLTSDGVTDGAHLHLGVADAVQQGCRSIGHPDNETATTSSQCEFSDRLVVHTDQTSGATPTIQVEGRFVQFTPGGGFSINWLVNDGVAAIYHVLMFHAPNADLRFVEAPNTGTAVVNDLSYTPVGVLVMSTAIGEGSAGTPSPSYNFGAPFGAFQGLGLGDGSDQLVAWTLGRGTGAASDCNADTLTSVCQNVRTANLAGAGSLSGGTITALVSGGYTYTRTVADGNGKTPLTSFLSLGGINCAIGTSTCPASASVKSVSVGFRPDAVLIFGCGQEPTFNSMGMFIGACQRDGTQGGVWIGGVDNASPSVYARSNHSDKAIRAYTPNATGSASSERITADCTITDTGFDLNFTVTPGTSVKFHYLAIASIVVSVPVPIATPLAARTPCVPTTQLGNGGKGKSGCNIGGIGIGDPTCC